MTRGLLHRQIDREDHHFGGRGEQQQVGGRGFGGEDARPARDERRVDDGLVQPVVPAEEERRSASALRRGYTHAHHSSQSASAPVELLFLVPLLLAGGNGAVRAAPDGAAVER